MQDKNWQPLNDAKIKDGTPVTLTTDSRQWANSFSFDLDLADRHEIESDFDLAIIVDIEAIGGDIGVSVVTGDMTEMLGSEVCSSRTVARNKLQLMIKNWKQAGHIIIRKTSPSPEPVNVNLYDTSVKMLPIEKINFDAVNQGSDAKKFQPEYLFEELRKKWCEVPAGRDNRAFTNDLLSLSDEELISWWLSVREESTTGLGYPIRGWYNDLYKDQFKGKSVADIGSGMGIDGVFFARNGAKMTFADIAPTNLKVIERLLTALGVGDAEFVHLENMQSIEKLAIYDFMWCQGSMINAPFKTMKEECRLLLEHLPMGGRWIELCYPKERWIREGALPFAEWGERTDGTGTPWMEWYDLERLLTRLEPAKFEPILALNFHNDDFNWFDLKKVS